MVIACFTFHIGYCQNWALTSAPVKNWSAVASSTDGSKLFATVKNGGIYISTNAGASWYLGGAPTRYWYAIATSSDGSNLVAAATGGTSDGIYTSTNLGAAWSYRTNLVFIESIASSANGVNLLAAQWGPSGNVYTSTNSGAVWRLKTSVAGSYWTASACSADGSKLFVGQGGSAYGSTNAGDTWRKINTNALDSSGSVGMSCSADGNVVMLVAAGGSFGGGIYVSTNGGSTWRTNTVERAFVTSVAVCADGSHAVVLDAGLNYFTSDAGKSWVSNNIGQSLKYVAAAADGTRLVAAIPNGNVYVAQPPSLNLQETNGTGIVFWPSLAVGWNLKFSTDLSATNWISPSETFQDDGAKKFVVVRITNGSCFYRLSNP